MASKLSTDRIQRLCREFDLNERQEKFVLEYLRTDNAAQAARFAGYKGFDSNPANAKAAGFNVKNSVKVQRVLQTVVVIESTSKPRAALTIESRIRKQESAK